MKLLVVIADKSELDTAKRLLAKAGVQAQVWLVNSDGFKSKPSMKQLRELKPILEEKIKQHGDFDYVIALGETASRLVLDTSSVSINRLRGRDFDYAYGVKTPGKKKDAVSEGS